MTFDDALASAAGPTALAEAVRLSMVTVGRPPDLGALHESVVQLAGGTPLEALAPARTAALVRDPATIARYPLQATLFPQGLLLGHPQDYRIWLAARVPPPAATMPATTLILPATRASRQAVLTTVQSALATDWPGLDVIVPGLWFPTGLRRLAAADPRLRLLTAWSNPLGAALAQAHGTVTALLAPGDRLDPAAAPLVAAALAEADVVLTDEDGVDAAGYRTTPRFGEAWDPDRALAAPRPGMLLARTAVIRETGGLPRGTTPWDLLLRLSRHTTRITHVPALLLTRRAPAVLPRHAVRTAQMHLDAHRDAHRDTAGSRVTAQRHGATIRARYPLPSLPPRASIVIATRNRAELLGPCIEGILHRTDYPDIELVLVDNGSDDPTALALLDRLATDPRTRLLRQPGPFNWAALNNAGVAASTGDVVVLLNNDTDVVEPGWLTELVAQALRPGIGAVGAKLLYPDGTIQHAGIVLGRDGHAIHMWRGTPGDAPGYLDSLAVVREVSAVTGACVALPRAVYEAVGGCEAELPVTWNDVDLCLRVRARGLRVLWTPYARLLHLEQASRGSDDTPENAARFRREQAWMRSRWGDALTHDPFLNPQLLPSDTTLRLSTHLP